MMIFRILAAILHLGNLTIVKGGKNQDDAESSLIPVRFILFVFYYVLIHFSYIETVIPQFKPSFLLYTYIYNIQYLLSFHIVIYLIFIKFHKITLMFIIFF